MEKTYQNLVLAKYKYDAAIAKIENTLRNKVKFEFAVLFQQSDGFVILHTEETRNAPLSACLDIIKGKGELTYKDYIKECI